MLRIYFNVAVIIIDKIPSRYMFLIPLQDSLVAKDDKKKVRWRGEAIVIDSVDIRLSRHGR